MCDGDVLFSARVIAEHGNRNRKSILLTASAMQGHAS